MFWNLFQCLVVLSRVDPVIGAYFGGLGLVIGCLHTWNRRTFFLLGRGKAWVFNHELLFFFLFLLIYLFIVLVLLYPCFASTLRLSFSLYNFSKSFDEMNQCCHKRQSGTISTSFYIISYPFSFTIYSGFFLYTILPSITPIHELLQDKTKNSPRYCARSPWGCESIRGAWCSWRGQEKGRYNVKLCGFNMIAVWPHLHRPTMMFPRICSR